MKKNTILILGLFILLTGCSSKQTTGIDWSRITTQLKARELKADSSLFTGVNNPVMYENKVIGRQKSTKLFRVCQITPDSIYSIGEFLNLGNGPYEMKMPTFEWNFQGHYLVISDYYNGQNKIFYIPTDSTQKIFDVNTWEISKFTPFQINSRPIYPDALVCLEKDKFITTTAINADKMFAHIDNPNNTIKIFDFDYPDDGCNIISSDKRPYAYGGSFKKHPYENKFVYCTTVNRYMLVTRYENGKMKEIAAPYKMYPQYTLTKDGTDIQYKKECYLGVIKIYPTSKNIYMLMNDDTWNDIWNNKLTDGYGSFFSNEVYVFDWNGNPVRKYTLDHRVDNIWADENDRAIYATTEDLANPDKGSLFLRYSLQE